MNKEERIQELQTQLLTLEAEMRTTAVKYTKRLRQRQQRTRIMKMIEKLERK